MPSNKIEQLNHFQDYGPIRHPTRGRPGGQPYKVRARGLFCYWAVRELGMSLRELAGRVQMTPPGIGYAVERGEAIAREQGRQLVD